MVRLKSGGSTSLKKYKFSFVWDPSYDVTYNVTHNLGTTKIVAINIYFSSGDGVPEGYTVINHDYVHFGWPWWVDRGILPHIIDENNIRFRLFNPYNDSTHTADVEIIAEN